MSLQSVREFLAVHAPEIEILEATTSTATVALAAAAHGVEPARIAKTLSLRLNGEAILVVMGGMARLDNRKYKDRFGAKAKMLDAEEVLEATSHPVGGVCPFGLPRPLARLRRPVAARVRRRRAGGRRHAPRDAHRSRAAGAARRRRVDRRRAGLTPRVARPAREPLQADAGAIRFAASSSGATMSIGNGKTIVEFLSAAITVSVSR